ncbi:D-Ala-D-Ala carboxypeptidase family metallohydrolase [Streptomyces sp. NBC_00201]|uniref:D-Ala-D-Ala carboxypeptidase family metallohydrolase n=1 Tax=unclassified Streptomyces TaxID=2593676 RepID=UPI00224EA42B|nr:MULTISPECIES: D-Ala-D-Ala carboxypeptidase family metallohydrolase [unclassified Streptomyces]MCX5055518.1 D-Ala-D-Ala carboxypeptidase family metallohydrolase [Streptomyces sp. NBC_00452]MCX5247636.1 D-Ala-D-Ala carboxypeptidase family metallohydrolase [Streptomyces sp. NBC_00201]MCX5286582.1 D-Ala-D-Ala carboxypeptidase family metallohydrolase [Streptomyces sp. NBC_00183]
MTYSSLDRRGFFRLGAGAVATAAGLAVVADLGLAGPAAAYGWGRNLSQGSSGNDVAELQIRVAGWAADSASQTYVAVDGSFGAGTAAALRRFQSAYGLSADGVAGPQTFSVLNSLEKSDGSTAHFDFSEFTSHDGSGFGGGNVGASEVKENVRRTMYKLEALRKKAGNSSVTINSGFRSTAYNSSIGGAGNSMHTYGVAADLAVSGHSTLQVYRIAETCGFSGLETHTVSWQHVDSRVEHSSYGSGFWWWQDGVA